MRFILLYILLISSFFGISQTNLVDPNTPVNAQPLISLSQDYQLQFSDEFSGSELDDTKWNVTVSNKSRAPRNRIGVDEWYWKSENVNVVNGNLELKSTKVDNTTMYCGSVDSRGKYEPQYGYYEVRLKIADSDKWTHTAFWFQGNLQHAVDGTANDGAEIDVFESAWENNKVCSVVHYDGYGSQKQNKTYHYSCANIHNGNYHTFSLHWTPNFMKIYYNGNLKATYDDVSHLVHAPEWLWLSVGASFGDTYQQNEFVNATNILGDLTKAYVDYVRVWRERELGFVLELDVNQADINGGTPKQDPCYPNGFAHALNKTGSLEFNFDVDFEENNQLFLHHLSDVDRIADVSVNNSSVNDFVFNDTGKPCWDGGSPRYNRVDSSEFTYTNDNLNTVTIEANGEDIGPIVHALKIVHPGLTLLKDLSHKTLAKDECKISISNEFLVFNCDKSVSKIDIYNVAGQRIKSLLLQNQQINISELPSGIYFTKLHFSEFEYIISKFSIN